MYKVCSRCGKIHKFNERCPVPRQTKDTKERRLRSKYCWTKKSGEIRQRAKYLCEVCQKEGKLTYDGVETHHIIKLSEDETGLLDNYNLIALCVYHHRQADNGEIEVDYLRELARVREDGK